MNNQLIEKIIKSNGETCPDILFKNSLIDKSVAQALSKSFIKILNISNENSNINNNLRLTILENIRKLCTLAPEGHLPIDEEVTESLSQLYHEQLRTTSTETLDKDLDAFLVRKLKSLHIESQHQPSINPEIIQALINLNGSGVYLDTLSKEIVHLDTSDRQFLTVVKSLWNNDDITNYSNTLNNDVSIKMKAEIEKLLLGAAHNILTNTVEPQKLLSDNESLIQLVQKAALSSECFQICCSILNFIFVMTNFDPIIQQFISSFVQLVKHNCKHTTFTVMYPIGISNVAVVLDIAINELPDPFKSSYINMALKLLNEAREISEYDFLMLLSHFHQWFDIYFDDNSLKTN